MHSPRLRDRLGLGPLIVAKGVEVDSTLGSRDEALNAIDADRGGTEHALDEASKGSTGSVELGAEDSYEQDSGSNLGGDDVVANLGLTTASVGGLVLSFSTTAAASTSKRRALF